MVPGHTAFNPAFLASAHALKDCAIAWRASLHTTPPGPLPAGCAVHPITDVAPTCTARSAPCGDEVTVTCATNAAPLVLQQKSGTSYTTVDSAPAGAALFTESPSTASVTYRACVADLPTLCSPDFTVAVHLQTCPCHTPAQCCEQAGGTWDGKYCE